MNLTDHEKTVLDIFNSEAGAYGVVYKLVKHTIEQKRDLFTRNINARKDMTNEQVGANLRSFDEATLLVDAVFREIGQHKKLPEVDTKNPGK